MGIVVMGLGAAGCSGDSPTDNLPRQPIAGLVLVDGRPLRKGSILFFPAHHPVWGATVSGGSMINDGRFSIPWDKGLVPGTTGSRSLPRKTQSDKPSRVPNR